MQEALQTPTMLTLPLQQFKFIVKTFSEASRIVYVHNEEYLQILKNLLLFFPLWTLALSTKLSTPQEEVLTFYSTFCHVIIGSPSSSKNLQLRAHRHSRRGEYWPAAARSVRSTFGGSTSGGPGERRRRDFDLLMRLATDWPALLMGLYLLGWQTSNLRGPSRATLCLVLT